MFKKIFGKTAKKTEETLGKADETLDSITEIAVEMKEVMKGIKTLITLSTIGVSLGIATSIFSILVSGRNVKIIKE